MKRASGIMLKALISEKGKGKTLLHYLSEKEQTSIDSLNIPEQTDFQALISTDSFLKEIHYSWFLPLLADMPESTLPLFLNLLPPRESDKIREHLKTSKTELSLSPFARAFLHEYLKKQIIEKDILPEAQLPPSTLNRLLLLTKEELTHLIDLLGLYDLSAELRHVVDKQLLTKIHSVLTPTQIQFLQYAGKQPMKWIPPHLNLDGWDKEKKSLYALLHKRGLYRLAKAVLNEDPSFHWHLIHRLDTGRGEYLTKLFAGKEDPAMITFFKGQVLHLLQRHR